MINHNQMISIIIMRLSYTNVLLFPRSTIFWANTSLFYYSSVNKDISKHTNQCTIYKVWVLSWHIGITFIFFCDRPFFVTINLTICFSLTNRMLAKHSSHFINKCEHFKLHSLASMNVEQTLTTNQPSHVLCYVILGQVSEYDNKFHQTILTKVSYLISNYGCWLKCKNLSSVNVFVWHDLRKNACQSLPPLLGVILSVFTNLNSLVMCYC